MFKVGQKVRARFANSTHLFPGTVKKDNGNETFAVRFDDGDLDEAVKAALIVSPQSGTTVSPDARLFLQSRGWGMYAGKLHANLGVTDVASLQSFCEDHARECLEAFHESVGMRPLQARQLRDIITNPNHPQSPRRGSTVASPMSPERMGDKLRTAISPRSKPLRKFFDDSVERSLSSAETGSLPLESDPGLRKFLLAHFKKPVADGMGKGLASGFNVTSMPQLIAMCGLTAAEEAAAIKSFKGRPMQLTAFDAKTLVKLVRTKGHARSALSPEAQRDALHKATTKVSPRSVKSFDLSVYPPLMATTSTGGEAGNGVGMSSLVEVTPEVRKFLLGHGLVTYVEGLQGLQVETLHQLVRLCEGLSWLFMSGTVVGLPSSSQSNGDSTAATATAAAAAATTMRYEVAFDGGDKGMVPANRLRPILDGEKKPMIVEVPKEFLNGASAEGAQAKKMSAADLGGAAAGAAGMAKSESSLLNLPSNLGVDGGSQELKDFMKCFVAMAEASEEGKKLRKAGFSSADPNGNGLCSLAELEGFVLKALLAKFPKDMKKKDDDGNPQERGRDLFDAFRPCYIRAFSDAKDYKADTGKVISGTKKATADDFVSKGEFRLFCCFIVIYAAMFDAFAKIDGGGAGRDANDDRRIELTEWVEGFQKVSNYGFVALRPNTTSDSSETGVAASPKDSVSDATFVFKQMDDNGGGFVLLDEFCTFIKATEMKEGTAMGLLLGADEDGGVGKQDRATKVATAEAATALAGDEQPIKPSAAPDKTSNSSDSDGNLRTTEVVGSKVEVQSSAVAFSPGAICLGQRIKAIPPMGTAGGGVGGAGAGGGRHDPVKTLRGPELNLSLFLAKDLIKKVTSERDPKSPKAQELQALAFESAAAEARANVAKASEVVAKRNAQKEKQKQQRFRKQQEKKKALSQELEQKRQEGQQDERGARGEREEGGASIIQEVLSEDDSNLFMATLEAAVLSSSSASVGEQDGADSLPLSSSFGRASSFMSKLETAVLSNDGDGAISGGDVGEDTAGDDFSSSVDLPPPSYDRASSFMSKLETAVLSNGEGGAISGGDVGEDNEDASTGHLPLSSSSLMSKVDTTILSNEDVDQVGDGTAAVRTIESSESTPDSGTDTPPDEGTETPS